MNVVLFIVFRIKCKIGSNKIELAIVITKRTAIIPSAYLPYLMKRFPGSSRIRSRTHKKTIVRRTKIHPKLIFIIPYGACPNSLAVTIHPVPIQFRTYSGEVVNYMADNFPVYEIFGMKHYHARRKLHSRRYGIIIVTHTYGIKVAVICRKNRVNIGSISLVSPPSIHLSL